MGRVIEETYFTVAVADFLRKEGFIPASSIGEDSYSPKREDYVGILCPGAEQKQRGWFPRLMLGKIRRRFLGVIWFDNDTRGATPNSWVFDYYGPDMAEVVKSLASPLAKQFNVDVRVRCVNQESREESFFEDGQY